jgi:hypothetical protein
MLVRGKLLDLGRLAERAELPTLLGALVLGAALALETRALFGAEALDLPLLLAAFFADSASVHNKKARTVTASTNLALVEHFGVAMVVLLSFVKKSSVPDYYRPALSKSWIQCFFP